MIGVGGLVAEVRGPRLQGGGGPGEAGTQESAGEGAQRGGGGTCPCGVSRLRMDI